MKNLYIKIYQNIIQRFKHKKYEQKKAVLIHPSPRQRPMHKNLRPFPNPKLKPLKQSSKSKDQASRCKSDFTLQWFSKPQVNAQFAIQIISKKQPQRSNEIKFQPKKNII